jgi:hypothetical protein
MDPDSDLAIFVIDLQDANKKLIFLTKLQKYAPHQPTHLEVVVNNGEPVGLLW